MQIIDMLIRIHRPNCQSDVAGSGSSEEKRMRGLLGIFLGCRCSYMTDVWARHKSQ